MAALALATTVTPVVVPQARANLRQAALAPRLSAGDRPGQRTGIAGVQALAAVLAGLGATGVLRHRARQGGRRHAIGAASLRAAAGDGPSVEERVVKLAKALKITTTTDFGFTKVSTAKLLAQIEPFVLDIEAAEEARAEAVRASKRAVQEAEKASKASIKASEEAVEAAQRELAEGQSARTDLETSVAEMTATLEEPQNELRKRAREQEREIRELKKSLDAAKRDTERVRKELLKEEEKLEKRNARLKSKLETVEMKYEEAESYAKRRRQAEQLADQSCKEKEEALSKQEELQRDLDGCMDVVRHIAEAQGYRMTKGSLWMKRDLTFRELLDLLDENLGTVVRERSEADWEE